MIIKEIKAVRLLSDDLSINLGKILSRNRWLPHSASRWQGSRLNHLLLSLTSSERQVAAVRSTHVMGQRISTFTGRSHKKPITNTERDRFLFLYSVCLSLPSK
jgi:hypothetical protein